MTVAWLSGQDCSIIKLLLLSSSMACLGGFSCVNIITSFSHSCGSIPDKAGEGRQFWLTVSKTTVHHGWDDIAAGSLAVLMGVLPFGCNRKQNGQEARSQ